MKKDTIYSQKREKIPPFEFNDAVVNVFDDMIHRSVPFYKETVFRLAQLSRMYYQADTRIYDLGCSNGNFGICFIKEMGDDPFEMVAVDNSKPMLDVYKKRLANEPNGGYIKLERNNIQDVKICKATVAVLNLTLQFLPLAGRDNLINHIYGSLLPDGILLVTEKVSHPNREFTDMQQQFYHRFKKEKGYSNMEISQKRDALENVLIPEAVADHLKRFSSAGFKNHDIWFKWFNFVSFICKK